MSSVVVSEKYQIVIPKEVRENSRIRPGTRLEVVEYGNRIELVPLVDFSELQGMHRGINTDVERDGDE